MRKQAIECCECLLDVSLKTVHQHNDGTWAWFDESGNWEFVGFETQERAKEEFNRYCKILYDGTPGEEL